LQSVFPTKRFVQVGQPEGLLKELKVSLGLLKTRLNSLFLLTCMEGLLKERQVSLGPATGTGHRDGAWAAGQMNIQIVHAVVSVFDAPVPKVTWFGCGGC
jgi:hypothetical protein